MRRRIGTGILALSVVYSGLELLGWLRPVLLRWRADGGPRRVAAILLGSLFLKAAVLTSGALLAFWPERRSTERGTPKD